MPNLPTFTVTDPIAQRLLAAFSGEVDGNGNPITPTVAYKTWLKGHLIAKVRLYEATKQTDLEDGMPL